jgi:hypothetical protein
MEEPQGANKLLLARARKCRRSEFYVDLCKESVVDQLQVGEKGKMAQQTACRRGKVPPTPSSANGKMAHMARHAVSSDRVYCIIYSFVDQ